jgi:hypothetical protein
MIRFHRMIVALVALSLAVVPTAANAFAAAMAATAASPTSDCSPCPMMHAVEAAGGMPNMVAPGGCHDTDGNDRPMTLAACAMFCGGLIALPSPGFVMADVVSAKLSNPHVELTLAGHIEPPEPHPPKP